MVGQTGVQIGANQTIHGSAASQVEGQSSISVAQTVEAKARLTTSGMTGIYQGVFVYNPKFPYYIPPPSTPSNSVYTIERNKEFLDIRGFARVSKYYEVIVKRKVSTKK